MKTLAIILVSTLGVLAMFDAVQADNDIGCNEYGKSGYVYIIQEGNGDYYKIGGTSDLIKRLSDLQTGNPRKLDWVRVYTASDCKVQKTWQPIRLWMTIVPILVVERSGFM